MQDGVGRKTVQYVNCLQSLNRWPEHAAIIILNSAMNLTHKNQGIYYDTRGRIKLWNLRSVLNVIVHILKNPVNSYILTVLLPFSYLLWGMRNRTCHFSVYIFFLRIP